MSPHGLFFLAFCSLGAPALAFGTGCSNEAQASQPTTPEEAAEVPGEDAASEPALALTRAYDPNESLAPMLDRVQPAVVAIVAASDGPFGMQSGGIGSGFIISADGRVVTNHHVVAGRDRFEVELEDGRRFRAQVIGSDPQTDIAVIQLEGAHDLPAVGLGSSEDLKVGDWVVAVGSPMGLRQTVTRGILSAKGRGSLGLYQDGYADFLQTDAAINPGNSGGPLFSLTGEVVGINTAVGGHDGLGFAIPVDQAKIVIPKLIDDGKITRGWLGIVGRDTPPEYGQFPEAGALVEEVHDGTPAATYGLHAGDRVLAVDGREVSDFDDLRGRIGEYAPKDRVTLTLLRAGEQTKLEVELGERPTPRALGGLASFRGQPGVQQPQTTPKSKAPQQQSGDLYGGGRARLGVEVRASEDGLAVVRVLSGSVGERLGLRAGDILMEVNGKPVRSVEQVAAALEADRGRASVSARRGQSTHTSMISVN
ncbi:trypsin-like peptidase domain-containing protein [Pseudenhygromyxa sp. WMMC2535]|uniref:trypsin-like peptidase domain-containing protein n=1 Tax=Pseudenhygromyxa sp. WMMC2535 TaxID=2712867 RepID=UPI001595BA50|nr:trypsin-like peptidase domain-containing protein [Pseudenhygromyxa sp. WMMC2535]NVB40647.1 trypsin-like peptidase domain-containing protein [Pseudenhygromyxa sp. WMMC2535]